MRNFHLTVLFRVCEIVSSIKNSGYVLTYITDGNWALDSIRASDVPRESEKTDLKHKFERESVRFVRMGIS